MNPVCIFGLNRFGRSRRRCRSSLRWVQKQMLAAKRSGHTPLLACGMKEVYVSLQRRNAHITAFLQTNEKQGFQKQSP
jgi:hypothetical protein